MAKNKYIREPVAGRASRAMNGPKKQEHKDVLVRDVLVCVNGVWSKFENLLKAKTILLPENHDCIYINADDMLARCPKKFYQHVERDFGLDTHFEVWDHFWNTAKNPYATVEHYRELDGNPAFKPVKTRNKRKLSYRCAFDENDERQMTNYFALPPQARAILDIMFEETKRLSESDPTKHVHFTEQELEELIEREKDRLATRQSSWRIFQYYRGKLIQYNFLRYAR